MKTLFYRLKRMLKKKEEVPKKVPIISLSQVLANAITMQAKNLGGKKVYV